MRYTVTFIILLLAATVCNGHWLQAGANPARTGHVEQAPKLPVKFAWVKTWDEDIHNSSTPVIAGGVIYQATAAGKIHAIDAQSGRDKWVCELGTPVLHTPACDSKSLYCAAMDGTVYAVSLENGQIQCKQQLSRRGFSTGVLLYDGDIYVAGRDGKVYSLTSDGKKRWEYDSGAPIEQTPAAADGKVVFVNKAMRAYCLNADKGEVLWKTKIIGASVRDYWPVIHNGKVIIRTRQAGPRELQGHMHELQQSLFFPASYGSGPKPEQIKFKADTVADILTEQKWVQEYFEQNPAAHTATVLNLSDGSEPYKVSVVAGCCNSGTIPPVVLAGDGNIYLPFPTSAAHRGVINITRLGLGRLNLQTGLIDEPLLCAGGEGVSDVIGVKTPFELTSDETVGITSAGDLLIGIRCGIVPGIINVRTRQTSGVKIPDRPLSQDMQAGANFVAVSGNYLAYVKNDELICMHGAAPTEIAAEQERPQPRPQKRPDRDPNSRPDRNRPQRPIQWVNKPSQLPANVSHHTYYSQAMDCEVGFCIYEPKDYKKSGKCYPVLYWLHGVNGDELNYIGWFTKANKATGRPARQIDESDNIISLLDSGKVEQMFVVFVNGGRGSGYRDQGPVKAETTFIKELIPYVDSHWPTIAEQRARAVEGFSMGGGGTLYFAGKYPDMFCSAVIYGMGLSRHRSDPQSIERTKQLLKNMKSHGLKVFLAGGSKDRPIYRKALSDLMTEVGLEHEYADIEGVGHNIYDIYQAVGLKGLRMHAQVLTDAR